jgi:hypothetical protein
VITPITPTEYERLILLGNTEGVPFVLEDALRSVNTMDPAYFLRVEDMDSEWGRWVVQVTPYFLRRKRVHEELARLVDLGQRMGGVAYILTYDFIRAKIGLQPPAQEGSVLRIQTQEHGHVDMMLTEHEDSMVDCLMDASQYVPKFQAFFQQPEPVLVFEHEGGPTWRGLRRCLRKKQPAH